MVGLQLVKHLLPPLGQSTCSGALEHRSPKGQPERTLAILIDPLSLPSFRKAYESVGGQRLPTTSPENPDETLQRVVYALKQHGRMRDDTQFKGRVALVLTKADVPHFKQIVGVGPDEGTLTTGWSRLGAANSDIIEHWLANSEPALFQALRVRFPNRRCFASSAYGLGSRPGLAFCPSGVNSAVGWLLSTRASMRRPRLARVLIKTSELLAAATVLVLLIVAPAIIAVMVLTDSIMP